MLQLSGRAGRRGLDTLGHVVLCHSNYEDVRQAHTWLAAYLPRMAHCGSTATHYCHSLPPLTTATDYRHSLPRLPLPRLHLPHLHRQQLYRPRQAYSMLLRPADAIASHFCVSYNTALRLLATRPLDECRQFVSKSFGAFQRSTSRDTNEARPHPWPSLTLALSPSDLPPTPTLTSNPTRTPTPTCTALTNTPNQPLINPTQRPP